MKTRTCNKISIPKFRYSLCSTQLLSRTVALIINVLVHFSNTSVDDNRSILLIIILSLLLLFLRARHFLRRQHTLADEGSISVRYIVCTFTCCFSGETGFTRYHEIFYQELNSSPLVSVILFWQVEFPHVEE
jgi:hypothetical protein